MHSTHGIKIFTCNSNIPLAEEVVGNLDFELGKSEVGKFSDGEINVRIDEKVRGEDVYIIQSVSPPVNDNLMELLIMIDAMRRASAGRINAVVPYFGYARQDRKTRARDPISAKLVANLITVAGADRVISIDLHCSQIQGFFDIPVDHLYAHRILADYFAEKYGDTSNMIVVSPDLGSVSRARTFATKLDVPLAIVDKRRPRPNVSEVMNIIGNIEGKHAILIDDVIDTAGTITNAANALKEGGAVKVSACASHGLFSYPANELIENSAISELIITNTIEQNTKSLSSKVKVLSVASLIADAIDRIHEDKSISVMFN